MTRCRGGMEVSFLQTLARSTIPATIMWGVHDMVAPVRVADYVFTTSLRHREVPGASWLMPCANHYVQHDQPADLARIIRLTLTLQTSAKPLPSAPYSLSIDPCSPVPVSRTQPPGQRSSTSSTAARHKAWSNFSLPVPSGIQARHEPADPLRLSAPGTPPKAVACLREICRLILATFGISRTPARASGPRVSALF